MTYSDKEQEAIELIKKILRNEHRRNISTIIGLLISVLMMILSMVYFFLTYGESSEWIVSELEMIITIFLTIIPIFISYLYNNIFLQKHKII